MIRSDAIYNSSLSPPPQKKKKKKKKIRHGSKTRHFWGEEVPTDFFNYYYILRTIIIYLQGICPRTLSKQSWS